jgi:hypothetical protein
LNLEYSYDILVVSKVLFSNSTCTATPWEKFDALALDQQIRLARSGDDASSSSAAAAPVSRVLTETVNAAVVGAVQVESIHFDPP